MNGVYSASGPVSAVGCSSYSPLSSEVLAKLKSMETTWKCAGICEVSNKYLFSDVTYTYSIVNFSLSNTIFITSFQSGESRTTKPSIKLLFNRQLEIVPT